MNSLQHPKVTFWSGAKSRYWSQEFFIFKTGVLLRLYPLNHSAHIVLSVLAALRAAELLNNTFTKPEHNSRTLKIGAPCRTYRGLAGLFAWQRWAFTEEAADSLLQVSILVKRRRKTAHHILYKLEGLKIRMSSAVNTQHNTWLDMHNTREYLVTSIFTPPD